MSDARIRRSQLWRAQRGLCYYCRTNVPRDEATLDHRVPKCVGGGIDWQNAVMACQSCNAAKADRSEAEFRASLERAEARRAAAVPAHEQRRRGAAALRKQSERMALWSKGRG